MIYQFAYEILDIIMKIWPIITPIMTIIFSTCCPNSNTLICKLDTVYKSHCFCLFDVYSCHFIFRKTES